MVAVWTRIARRCPKTHELVSKHVAREEAALGKGGSLFAWPLKRAALLASFGMPAEGLRTKPVDKGLTLDEPLARRIDIVRGVGLAMALRGDKVDPETRAQLMRILREAKASPNVKQ